jgi:hypothetical protein
MAGIGSGKNKTFEVWKEKFDADLAKKPAAWDEYDVRIKYAVDEFNWHLRNTPLYPTLDWRIIKAILWVESGAWNLAWKTRPMQIGNKGDSGLHDLLGARKTQGKLVTPDKFQAGITESAVRSDSETNIRAGIALLLLKMAVFKEQDIVMPGSQEYDVTVEKGDSFSTIAKREGSVPGVLQKLNSKILPQKLQPGQTIKCQKATRQLVITHWDPGFNSVATIADKYNGVSGKGGGDINYVRKLEYALDKVCK